jgi:ABC-2 type transport system permease protein
MNRSLVGRLILKDWDLHRSTLFLVGVGGVIGLSALLKGGIVTVLGLTAVFVLTIVLGIMLPTLSVINERNKQNLPFVMSLPISAMEYVLAKILANLSMYMVLWLVLVGGLLFVISGSGINGLIPPIVMFSLAPLVGFCVMLGVALSVNSDTFSTWTTALCNVAYGLLWLYLTRIPGIREQAFGPVAVWNPWILWAVACELLLLAATFGFIFFMQSRKTSFLQ